MQSKIFQLTAGWLLLCATATTATYYGSIEFYDRLSLQQYFPEQSQNIVTPSQASIDQVASLLPVPQDQHDAPGSNQQAPAPAPVKVNNRSNEGGPISGFYPASPGPPKSHNNPVAGGDIGEPDSRDQQQQSGNEKQHSNSLGKTSGSDSADPRYYEVTAKLETLEGRYREVQASLGAIESRLAQRGMGGLQPELKVKMAEVKGGLAGAKQALGAGQVDQAAKMLGTVKNNLEYLENYGRN